MTNPYRAMCAELVDAIEQTEANRQHGLPLRIVTETLDRARDLLAQPQPPADGDVGEVIAVLRDIQDCFDIASGMEGCGPFVTRAADLLQRLASPAHLVINPSPEALAALKAAGPGRIEAMPANALHTPEVTND